MTTLSVVIPASDEPPTLAACLTAIRNADEPPEQVIVATEGRSPAEARNLGALQASCDVLVFVDADVLPHGDVFTRIRAAFEVDRGLDALFGSYDDAPAHPGFVSAFRNLLHHHVHAQGAGPAQTFWTGLGSVRRHAFEEIGGFDPHRRYLEDVDFGIRLRRAGGRILLDPAVQGTHLKQWTLAAMVWTDLVGRGLPWVDILLQHGEPPEGLNLGWRHRLSALASVGLAAGLLRRRVGLVLAGAASLVLLNRSFYALLARKRGTPHAAAGVGLHAIHHLVGVAGASAGALKYVRDSLRRTS